MAHKPQSAHSPQHRPGQYRRAIHLARLIDIDPESPGGGSAERSAQIRARLLQAIARERARAQTAHWSYSRARHRALIAALSNES